MRLRGIYGSCACAFIVLLAASRALPRPPTAPTLAGRVTVAAGEPQCSPKGCGASAP